ncbi:MAG: DinB family protein [Chloroflexota bacterium]|nr:DinB family protein [Chloroflexota bacterium]
MRYNLALAFSGQAAYADLIADLDHAGLVAYATDLYRQVAEIVAGVDDAAVTRVAQDAAAAEGEAGWTLGHLIVHANASAEEGCAVGSSLARGVPFEGRSRYEVPWETVQTARQLHERVAEGRRICLAFLQTWPDAPHLDLTITRIPQFGPLNAIQVCALGLIHLDGHLDQLREVVRQAQAA